MDRDLNIIDDYFRFFFALIHYFSKLYIFDYDLCPAIIIMFYFFQLLMMILIFC